MKLTSNLATVVTISEDPLHSEGNIIGSGCRRWRIEQMCYDNSTVVGRNLAKARDPTDLIIRTDGDDIVAERDEEVEAHNHVVHVCRQQLSRPAAACAALIDVFNREVARD